MELVGEKIGTFLYHYERHAVALEPWDEVGRSPGLHLLPATVEVHFCGATLDFLFSCRWLAAIC
jgi:hypothetical protein